MNQSGRQYTDKEVVDLLRSDNSDDREKGMRFVYRQYYRMIRHLITTNSGTETDAEDIFQDSLIVFYNQIQTGKFELKAALSNYLYTVSRNLWIKRLRKAQRSTELTDTQKLVPLEEDHFESLIQSERSQLIAKLMQQMSPGCREVLLFFYYEQLSMKTIAKRLGLSSEQAAKNKKWNCLKKLRELSMAIPEIRDALKK